MSGDIRLITADDLCVGAQTILVGQLGALIEALGLDERPRGEKPFELPKVWDQVPTLEALETAKYPAAAITSTGVVGTPRTTRSGGTNRVDATFLVRVGIFDRGPDYNVTAARIRTWAALVRGVLLLPENASLGGVASGVRFVTESYRNLRKEVARTIGGCTVDFHVDVQNIADLSALDVLPVVGSTHSTISVNNHQE